MKNKFTGHLLGLITVLATLLPVSLQGKLNPYQFPDMLIYRQNADTPYMEVWYTGSLNKLRQSLKQEFRGKQNEELKPVLNDSSLILSDIADPDFIHDSYTLRIKLVNRDNAGALMHIYCESEGVIKDLLQPRYGFYRNLMALIQKAIDRSNRVNHTDRDQNPNTVLLFEPKDDYKNLYGYLFYYSKADPDSIMKMFSEILVKSCTEGQIGYWENDSTFRIDNLHFPELGYPGAFSLTIQKSKVERGYMQYVIYLSNYRKDDSDNNFEVRLHDIHHRLWRYYANEIYRKAISER